MITAALIFFPLLAGVITLLLGAQRAKFFALGASVITFVISLLAYNKLWTSPYDLDFNQPWIESLGIGFNLSMDGISLLLVLLTTFLVPLIILSSFRTQYNNASVFYALILFMQSALIGVFTSADLFLFYLFWELALIPIYFISLVWGGENRGAITFKFFLYTLVGSLFMLLGVIYLYLRTPGDHTFDKEAIYALVTQLSLSEQTFVFVVFFLAFAIKMPVFPFHTWQPATYTNAPTQGTMLLSGIMLKMGIYGVIRWMIPVVPQAMEEYGCIAALMAVTGIVYASIIAIQQKNIKTLIAYSSIAHVGLIAAALFAGNVISLQGVMLQMLSHGIVAVGLFFLIDIIQDRTGTLTISELGGLRNQAPYLAIFYIIIMMAAVSLPGTSGFSGEFLLFVGLSKYNIYLTAVAGLTIILGAVYMLSSFQKVMLGETKAAFKDIKDISGLEMAVLIPIVILIIWIGVYPASFLDISADSVNALLKSTTINSASLTR
jgi:NADH-quinone oxidoreductase subunit M